jgi:hypothetical protein
MLDSSRAVIPCVSRRRSTLSLTTSQLIVSSFISSIAVPSRGNLAGDRDTLDVRPKRIAVTRNSDIGELVAAGACSISPDGDYKLILAS